MTRSPRSLRSLVSHLARDDRVRDLVLVLVIRWIGTCGSVSWLLCEELGLVGAGRPT